MTMNVGCSRSALRRQVVFPGAPVYHYGSYELRAFQIAATKYGLDCAAVTDRFVNASSFVFGKVYFPTRSNRLKDLGGLLGASWTSADASGLSSLAWRYRWEDTGQNNFKEMLLTYNQEDCEAVRRLIEELQDLSTEQRRPMWILPPRPK